MMRRDILISCLCRLLSTNGRKHDKTANALISACQMNVQNRPLAAAILAALVAIPAAIAACGGDDDQFEYSRFGVYTATIVTDKGVAEVDLYNNIAWVYVENFIKLAQSGFYDGAAWHRVIPGQFIQTGVNANCGPERVANEAYPDCVVAPPFDDVFHPDMKHNDAGLLSMANRGLNTNTSHFFITHQAARNLDPYESGEPKPCEVGGVSCHAVFGKVTSGIEAVFNTREGDIIESITVHDCAENSELRSCQASYRRLSK